MSFTDGETAAARRVFARGSLGESRLINFAMGWDATLGVWEGNAALASAGAVPDPLWIFGYGSLCW